MYAIVKSVDIDMAHHVKGHSGPCINIHGHTWKFEVCVEAETLDQSGFVLDFGVLKRHLFQHVYDLLDHGFMISEDQFRELQQPLEAIAAGLVATRGEICGTNRGLFGNDPDSVHLRATHGVLDYNVKGMKIITSPFVPTSERLAKWFFEVADEVVKALRPMDAHRGLRVRWARVYEQVIPVAAYAEYSG